MQACYSRRAVRALDLQIVSAENPVANPDLRVIDVMYPAAAVVDLPDLAVGKPNARARTPALEMARNVAFDRLQRCCAWWLSEPELLALAGLVLTRLLFACRHH